MKIRMIIGICILSIIISGCSSSEYGDCYNICRSKEYQKVDTNCDWVSSSLVRKECSIPEDKMIEIKDNCFDECKQTSGADKK